MQNIVKKAHKPEGEFTMEIERKFLVKQIPEGCTSFPCRQIEQAYLNTDPVVRVRRVMMTTISPTKEKASYPEKNTILH